MLDGLKLSLEQVNYQAGGRKIELIEEDTEGNSATAIAKYRKLVDHDKIHVLTGILLVERGQQPGAADRARPAPHPVPHHARRPDQAQDRQVDPALELLGEPDHASAGRLRGEDAQVPPGGHHRHGQRLRPRGDRAASSACSRTAEARSCRSSGCRSTRSTSRRTSPRSSQGRRRGLRGLRGRPGGALRQAVRRVRAQGEDARSSAPGS